VPSETLVVNGIQSLVVEVPGPVQILTVGEQGPPGPVGPDGPVGPPNTTPISSAPGNALILGPDNGLFVQQVWSGTPAW
jgi:hypothetical protein